MSIAGHTCLAVLLAAFLLSPLGAYANEPQSCTGSADLLTGEMVCKDTLDSVNQTIASSPANFAYEVTPRCGEDMTLKSESCLRLVQCSTVPDGIEHHLWRQDLNDPPGQRPWVRVGSVCLGPGEAEQIGAITPGLVQREMEELTWSKSELVIQPPDGVTLVNLPTNFYTENTAPTRQSVDLLGQRVEIEARPTSYVWRFSRAGDGDGREGPQSRTTTSPGAPYPDLDVTYAYRYAPVTMSPSVDTVYTGRYRVNGGPWQGIPETLTVEGEPQALQVKEAAAQLVSP